MTTHKTSPALDRWADDGGALSAEPAINEASRCEQEILHRVIECLGYTVVAVWSSLPRDIQRTIFKHAVTKKPGHLNCQNREIAVYLHEHKGY
jgi:hypothetical protein